MFKFKLFGKWPIIIIWDTTTYHAQKYPTRKPKIKEDIVLHGLGPYNFDVKEK